MRLVVRLVVRLTVRWPAVAGLLALAWAIVFLWRIGPVVLVLTATHGVHTGDSLAAFPVLAAGYLARSPATGRARSREASTTMSRTLIATSASPHHR